MLFNTFAIKFRDDLANSSTAKVHDDEDTNPGNPPLDFQRVLIRLCIVHDTA